MQSPKPSTLHAHELFWVARPSHPSMRKVNYEAQVAAKSRQVDGLGKYREFCWI